MTRQGPDRPEVMTSGGGDVVAAPDVPCSSFARGVAAVLEVEDPVPFLRIWVPAVSDNALQIVVRRSTGGARCAEGDAASPVWVEGPFPSGTYLVHVRSLRDGRFSFPLRVSTSPSSSVVAAELDATVPAEPARRIEADLLADDHRMSGRTAGEIPVRRLGPGCSGWTTKRAQAAVRVAVPRPALQVHARSLERDELTLLARGPDGAFRCSASSVAPRVDLTGAPAGVYLIWVGARGSFEQSYELTITPHPGDPLERDIDAFVAGVTEGHRQAHAARGALEAARPIEVSMRRGLCYRALFRADPDARVSARGVRFAALPIEQAHWSLRTIWSERVCPFRSSELRVAIEAPDPMAGGYALDVYSQPIPEGQLRALEQEATEHDRSEACIFCRREFDRCRARGERSCQSELGACMSRQGLGAGQCRE